MKETDIRERLVEALEADLVGPFVPDAHPQGGQEVLPIAPSRWYLTGFLAPQGARKPDEEDDESVDGGLAAGSESAAEDAGQEEPENKRPVRFPASMGLSVFLPPGGADALEVEVSYADYDKIELALDHTDKKRIGWKRVPHGPVKMTVPLDPKVLQHREGVPVPGSRGLLLRGELRTTDMDGLDAGTRVLSLFLVNDRTPVDRDRDLAFAFQVKMAVSYAAGFRARPNRRGEDGNDEDQRVLALMFRDRMEWGVGHNTSVERPEVKGGKVTRLATTQLPCFEVPRVDHRAVEDVTTVMVDLAKLDGKGLVNALSPLTDAYGAWIDEQRTTSVRGPLEGTRGDLAGKALRAKKRIEEGIALLDSDPQARRAFALANQAMHVAALQADKTREDPRYKNGKNPEWRPFQLAFVLMNLPSVVDPAHDDRRLAELIYFPTGGGKTEAYLGLIAFVLALRRLRGQGTPHEGRGVAVLLRYTLRLLTLDQLGRAATLVCALEELRRRNPKELGNARFTIGLWVGASATANRLKDVHQALSDYTSGRTDSPFPLTSCPWCGTAIKIQNIKLVDAEGKPTKKSFARAAVYCEGQSCPFTEAKVPGLGLPVLFVDEQIYQEVPSFLVATVDKFAMMPWRGDAGMLFGRATHVDDQRAYGVMHDVPKGARAVPEGLLPPELIVQDELHLISGPLGTMVGLYEAAVDYLCERGGGAASRPPKIVCSTATVRRAREQIQALFGRPMALFPPRGTTDGDNFFSKVLASEPGRLYVGVGAPGRALRAVSVRSYAVLLAAAQKHFDPKGDAKQPADPYMTLVGYFNSLRELGGMRRLVEDEVRNRVDDVESGKRPLLYVGPHPWAADRKLEMPAELTSRESTERVKETKQRLAARRTSKSPEPLDVVLASNMISVGLDVDRLGLMVVTGQPKTTSEYIQATSRVGRSYPGLVVACLNVMRPRDRSHYERFVAYHESFYREVEATSVTPFSGQALDRGLVGTLLSMIRHAVPEMEEPTGVMKLHHERPAAEQILAWLVARARKHRQFHDDEAEQRIGSLVQARGKSFLDAWERVADRARKEAGTDRTYSKMDGAGSEGKALLHMAGDDPPHDHDERHFLVPTSMRDVEPSAHVWLRFKQLDEKVLMVGKATGKKDGQAKRPDGQLRQSQLVTTFGPGAMVDLVDRAVVIGGLEHWGYGKEGWQALDDARLRRSLIPRLKALDPDLDLARTDYFRMPPEGDARDVWPGVGIKALEFPRWFVCQGCRRLARAAEAFENKGGRYRHECSPKKFSNAVPVRFVAACQRGHLSHFPWTRFAHMDREGGECDAPKLLLREQALGDIARIFVECTNCGSQTPMSRASVLPYKCNGDRPWLGGRGATEPCELQAELLVRTASHAYFAQVVSALRLPEAAPDSLRQRLEAKDVWQAVQSVTAAEELALLTKLMPNVKLALEGYAPEAVLASIRAVREGSAATAERPLRSAEYERLVTAEIEPPGVVVPAGVQFAAYRVPKSKVDLPPGVRGLVVVPELREVRVQVSFSRFDSVGANLQGEYDFEGRKVKPAVLTSPTGNEKWLPAAEVRGEGVFVELDEESLRAWAARDEVKRRDELLRKAFEAEGKGEYPGIRFYLLHSLSHLLLTAVSLECGYAASAIRERIYCGVAEAGGPDMAAVMLTTGTTGSEGTLGGLVEEGRRLRHHLREAWDLGRLCSNDPVCAAHDPSAEGSDRHTEGAACHGCLYIAECSCERFNRFLDRALVVPTIGNDPSLAFFRERP